MKKGQLQSSLTWIFVAIVGIIILLFFIGFAFNMLEFGEKKVSFRIQNLIYNKILALSYADDQTREITLPTKAEINFNCGTFNVKGSDTSERLNLIAFAPSELEGKTINMWSKRWNYPFWIANFYYITSPKNKIYVDADEGMINELTSYPGKKGEYINFSIPSLDLIKKQKLSYDLKFVFINREPEEYLGAYGDIIHITGEETGVIKFEDGNSYYIGYPMMLGAIFSDDKASYECMMDKAFEQMDVVSRIYSRKSTFLSQKSLNPSCSYSQLTQYLNIFASANSKNLFENYKNSIDQANSDLRGAGCVTLY